MRAGQPQCGRRTRARAGPWRRHAHPPVTVVVPLYNKVQYIRRCLRSIHRQTAQAASIIVVDDGSTDGSAGAAKPLLRPMDRLVHQDHAGASAARNAGVDLGRSELVAFVDADDEWLPAHLDLLLELHHRFPEAGAYATAYRVRDARGRLLTPAFRHVPASSDGGVIESYLRAVVEGRSPFCASSVVVRKTALHEVGGFPVGVPFGEDIDTWLRIALRYAIAWTPEPGTVYHTGAAGRVSQEPRTGDYPLARRIEEYQRAAADQGETASLLQEHLVKRRLRMVRLNCEAGDLDTARRVLRLCRGTKGFRVHRWRWGLRLLLARLWPGVRARSIPWPPGARLPEG